MTFSKLVTINIYFLFLLMSTIIVLTSAFLYMTVHEYANLSQSYFIRSWVTALPNSSHEQVLSRRWQSVGENKEMYVYSAYKTEQQGRVQVIAIVNKDTKDKLQCVFRNENDSRLWTVPGELSILPEHHAAKYRAAYIFCPVTIYDKVITVQISCQGTSRPMRVLYPEPGAYNFTVCVPALFGPFSNVNSIVAMIEADLMFGANKFIFYNHSVSPEVDKLLHYYMEKGILEVLPWDIPKVDVHYYGQIAVIQDCILANNKRSKFVVLKDTDEHIVPYQDSNWNELMARLHRDSSKAGCYLFRSAFFSRRIAAASERDIGSEKLNTSILSLLYVWRTKTMFNPKERSKLILIPERVQTAGIHFAWQLYPGFSESTVDTTIAYVHHYRLENASSTDVYDARMLKYADVLTINVDRVLQDL